MEDRPGGSCTVMTGQDPRGLTSPTLNPDDYREDLAGYDLSQEEQDELLGILWNIVCTMVDIGCGSDSTQMVMNHFTH